MDHALELIPELTRPRVSWWSALVGVAALSTALVVEPAPAAVVVGEAPRQVVLIIAPQPEPEAALAPPAAAEAEVKVESHDEYLRRGERFAAREQWERALVAYTWARDVRPHSAEAHVGRALVLLELRRPREAAAAVRRALALSKDHGEALVLQGLLAQLSGKRAEARAHYDAYLAAHPGGRWAGELEVILQRGEGSLAKVMRP